MFTFGLLFDRAAFPHCIIFIILLPSKALALCFLLRNVANRFDLSDILLLLSLSSGM